MSIFTDAVAVLQARWAEELVDSCVVKRETSTVFSTTTGTYTPTYTTVASSSCLVRPSRANDAESGDRQAELRMYAVYVPYTVTGPLPDDLVDITSTNDSFINGKQFVVRNIAGDSFPAIRRLDCEEVVDA